MATQSESLISLVTARSSVGSEVDESKTRAVQGAIRVRKPNKAEFVRVHPDRDQWAIGARVIEVNTDMSSETYILLGQWSLPSAIADEEKSVNLYRSMNHQGVEFIWKVKVGNGPGADWNESAIEAVRLATEEWVKVKANMGAHCYDIYPPAKSIPEPPWSSRSWEATLALAFKGRDIRSPEHRVIAALEGSTHGLG
jgi:hypothetical protein